MKLKNFRINLTVIALLSLFSYKTKAQIVAYDFYSFRLNNMYNANAAYTGKDEGVNVFLNAQTQNNGVDYSNKNFSGGIYSRISDKQAIGAKMISDSRGAFKVFKADMSYAYLLKIGKNQKLNFGVNMGLINTDLATDRIDGFDRLDASDEALYSPYFNSIQFTAGAGLLYINKKLEVSLSVPSLVSTNEGVTSYFIGAVFYKVDVNESLTLTPWFAYQNIPVTNNLSSLFVKSTYKDKLWAQIGYQSNNTICAMLGVKLDQLGIGYGYKFNNSEFNNIASGGHEISITYRFDKRSGASKLESGNQLVDTAPKLSQILSDLKSTSSDGGINLELQKEISEIQIELERLIAKGKNGKYEKEDEKAIKKLEERIEKLKLQLK